MNYRCRIHRKLARFTFRTPFPSGSSSLVCTGIYVLAVFTRNRFVLYFLLCFFITLLGYHLANLYGEVLLRCLNQDLYEGRRNNQKVL